MRAAADQQASGSDDVAELNAEEAASWLPATDGGIGSGASSDGASEAVGVSEPARVAAGAGAASEAAGW